MSFIFPKLEGAKVYNKYMNEIKSDVARTLEKRHNMCLIGEGTGAMHCVEMLSLSFQINRILTKENARKIIVDCVNEFTKKVNAHVKIRPYLKTFPFEGAQVTIYITDKNRRNIYDPEIGVVSYREGEITYYTDDPENKWKYKTKIKETLEEAMQILQSENKQSL